MANKLRIITLAVALLALGGITWAWVRSREPVYQGKRLSYWLEQYEKGFKPGTPPPLAEEAIRHIGTNALPVLFKMITARDSQAKKLAMHWSARQKVIKFHFETDSAMRRQALVGYSALGYTAEPQVPQLCLLLTNDSLPEVRMNAATVLGLIGGEARLAAPALLVTAKDTNFEVRNNSLWALSRIYGNPDLVIPGLIEALDDPYALARQNAAIALGRYGPLATNAVPALLRTTNITPAACSALLQIAPEVVAQRK
ncbi:HEAT repeat domain-containing protein [Pedosphaera parvula]|uniref:PBS lyase HEAT domain protein repeat-containing protein n=1 Tax=Pedosphaera parvula (strain Ellin514) TaxID=320771 RepID=B9XQN0_PEDPL|nr:HEAT repeat domain-containing protein [Pedosphaera parvula]EEF57880.1 hypothetical protein Cflav_PD0944 [Pedosphaera parvula Ellin514]